MTKLITGCAGFIGSKVSELLLQQEQAVVGIDNINDAYDPKLKRWRLAQLECHPGFQYHQIDICDRPAISSLFCKNNFDGVINLAARAGVRPSIDDPWTYYNTNLNGTLNLLEACREYNVPKFVLASTSSVYGNGDRPFQEDGPSDSPLSPYAASKKAAETLCYCYHQTHGLDVSILRYFTVYGPAGRPDMAIYRFIVWADNGIPIMLYGDGSQERDFTYVEDIANGTVLALQPLGFEVINLGCDQPVQVIKVIKLVESIVGKPATVESIPAHSADVSATWADISKAKNLLGWEPKVNLEDGLTKTAAWHFENENWAAALCIQNLPKRI